MHFFAAAAGFFFFFFLHFFLPGPPVAGTAPAAGAKVAPITVLPLSARVHCGAVPALAQAPVQALSTEPAAGVAVNVTVAPGS